jgi:hypothetical protein
MHNEDPIGAGERPRVSPAATGRSRRGPWANGSETVRLTAACIPWARDRGRKSGHLEATNSGSSISVQGLDRMIIHIVAQSRSTTLTESFARVEDVENILRLRYAKMGIGVHLSTSTYFAGGPAPIFNLRLTEPIEKGLPFRDIFSEDPSKHDDILASLSLTFPPPGYIEFGRAEVVQPGYEGLTFPRPVAVWGRLAEPKIGNTTDFTISPVGSNDSLILFAFDPRSFTATMFHRTEGLKLAPCVVSCADGKTAHPCVTCKSGHVEIRICC